MKPGTWIKVSDENHPQTVQIGPEEVKAFSSGGALWVRCPKLEMGNYDLVVDGIRQRSIKVG